MILNQIDGDEFIKTTTTDDLTDTNNFRSYCKKFGIYIMVKIIN